MTGISGATAPSSVLTLHPIGPTAFDALMDRLEDLAYQLDDAERRGARVETRLVRLMAHSGLDEQGNPARATRSIT